MLVLFIEWFQTESLGTNAAKGPLYRPKLFNEGSGAFV
jgi:hypothetical protein